MSKKPEPFNNPFSALKLEKPKPAEAKPQPARSAPPPKKSKGPVDDEAALFLEAVGEVAPVRQGKSRVGPPPPREASSLALPTEEAESLARLAELVSSDGEFAVSDSDEFLEGWVAGFDERVMRKLRAGEFPVQARVDLHGLTKDEAKVTLERFIQQSRVAGHRCVLVVTGKGMHSENQVPVLKGSVQAWLTHGRPAKQVLGFCSAQPKDGGTGAVTVLLRR